MERKLSNNNDQKHKEDLELVLRIVNRDPDAWKTFMDKYEGFIYGTIRSILNKCIVDKSSRAKARGMIDDLYLEFFEHLLDRDMALLRQYKAKSKLSTYLYTCLRHRLLDFFKSLRWRKYLRELSESDVLGYFEEDSESDRDILNFVDRKSSGEIYNPEKEAIRQEVRDSIKDILSTFTEKEALIFRLLFIEELKPREVANLTGEKALDISQMKYKIKRKFQDIGKSKLIPYLEEAY